MKTSPLIHFALLALAGFSPFASGAETLLVCQGQTSSYMASLRGPEQEQRRFTITKDGSRVVSVKTDTDLFTHERTDVRKSNGKGPVYRQLLVEPGKLILRYEITEDQRNADTIIFDTGRYTFTAIAYTSEGQCTVAQKVF